MEAGRSSENHRPVHGLPFCICESSVRGVEAVKCWYSKGELELLCLNVDSNTCQFIPIIHYF